MTDITAKQCIEAVASGTQPCASCRFSDYTVPSHPNCRAVFGDNHCKVINPTARCSMHERVPSPLAAERSHVDLTPIAWLGFWLMLGMAILAVHHGG